MAISLLTACQQLLQAEAPIRLRIAGMHSLRGRDVPRPSAVQLHPVEQSAAGDTPAASPLTSQHPSSSSRSSSSTPRSTQSPLSTAATEDGVRGAEEEEGRPAPGLACPCCRGASASPGTPCCSTYELRNAFINRPYSLDGPEAVRVLRCTECPGNCNCYHGERPVVLPVLSDASCCGSSPQSPTTGPSSMEGTPQHRPTALPPCPATSSGRAPSSGRSAPTPATKLPSHPRATSQRPSCKGCTAPVIEGDAVPPRCGPCECPMAGASDSVDPPCPHPKPWKRLRAKRHSVFFSCCKCGAEWRVPTKYSRGLLQAQEQPEEA